MGIVNIFVFRAIWVRLHSDFNTLTLAFGRYLRFSGKKVTALQSRELPARLWYLQCTSSLAADEMEVLTLLLATHLYWPASDRWTSVIVKVWLLFVEDAVSRELAVKFNLCSFFVHVTLGDGFPSTSQLKTTSCPSTVVRPSGVLEISAATEKYNKNVIWRIN